MTFKEEIELQSRYNITLSFEILSQIKGYHSGRAKQIGDTVLFGMLKEESEDGELGLKLITFHEEEIGTLYEEDIMFYRPNKINKLPNIKKIDNGGN